MDTGTGRGVAFVAFGATAEREYQQSVVSLLDWTPLPVVRAPAPKVPGTSEWTNSQRARWAKLAVLEWTPQAWEQVLYLDADTRVRDGLSAGFGMLDDGWELVITASENQGEDWLWHVSEAEREETRALFGADVLQLQGGMFFLARNERTQALMEAWQEEWGLYRDQDQGALLRALRRVPVKVWLLGRPWNGGAVVEHRFGMCRRG